jgi:hypothetical protein
MDIEWIPLTLQVFTAEIAEYAEEKEKKLRALCVLSG